MHLFKPSGPVAANLIASEAIKQRASLWLLRCRLFHALAKPPFLCVCDGVGAKPQPLDGRFGRNRTVPTEPGCIFRVTHLLLIKVYYEKLYYDLVFSYILA